MKKLVKILLPFIVASSAVLSGCNEDSKVYLPFGDVHVTESEVIKTTRLNELIANKESFLLVVSTKTCHCWPDFEAILNEYIVENKVICYRIDYDNFKDVAASYDLPYVTQSTTTFALFKDGVMCKSIRSDEQKNIMSDKKSFEKFMKQYVILPGCLLINKDEVKTIKESGKSAVIYFLRNGCGDCSALNPGILRKYVIKHQDAKKIYAIDCQEYWRRSTDEDYQSYLDFKDEIGLSKQNNPDYGFGSGVFPYFSYIENGTYASGAVVYNDTIENRENKYFIKESYYSIDRVAKLPYTKTVLEGKELKENELNIGRGISWKHEYADKSYEKILNSFLNYALEKTTFTF